MKIGEKQCTMLAQYRVLSATFMLHVCMMSNFQILHHFTPRD